MTKIRLFAMDVDGTMTDGKIYMGNSGELMKAFLHQRRPGDPAFAGGLRHARLDYRPGIRHCRQPGERTGYYGTLPKEARQSRRLKAANGKVPYPTGPNCLYRR